MEASQTTRFVGGYTCREVAQILGLSAAQLRGYIRQGCVAPRRGPRGEYRFSLQDLVLLRTARALSERVPPRRVRRALQKLKERLPSGRPLTGVQISAVGDDVVVREGARLWQAESGQGVFSFAIRAYELALASDSRAADAHYNLSRLYERLGKKPLAFRHLKAYRDLVRKE